MRNLFVYPLISLALCLASCSELSDSASAGKDLGAVPSVVSLPLSGAARDTNPIHEAQLSTKKNVPVSGVQTTELSVLGALSKEEAWWLVEHGFPTAQELDAVPHLDVETLSRAMHDGNGKAAALLGHVRAQQGDFSGASAAFARGAQLGSIYAMEQHAVHELLEWSDVRNGRIVASPAGHKALFVAKLEVAKMLGDHRADYYIQKYARDVDMSRYGDDILAQAVEYMRQYGMSEAPRAPDPRPNADLWEQVENADPSTMVSIHGRPSTFP